jgi:predicted secreted protein
MAGTVKPTVIPGTSLLILVGDGASPEVFTAPCGLTSNTFSLTAASGSTVIPFCDAPEAAAWSSSEVTSLSAQVTGSGVMAVESFAVWNNWFLNGVPKNAQVKLDNAALGSYTGPWILASFKLTGTRGQKVTVDITLDNSDIISFIPAT